MVVPTHNEKILTELDVTIEEIADLKKRKVLLSRRALSVLFD